jgi:DNA-binding NtrC family response regulator
MDAMPPALLASRYARDREGKLFDVATGHDVVLVTALDASRLPSERPDLLDRGRLDDGAWFVAYAECGGGDIGAIGCRPEALALRTAEALDVAGEGVLREIALDGRDAAAYGAERLIVASQAREAGCVPISLEGLRRLPVPAVLAHRSLVVLGPPGTARLASCATVLAACGLRARPRLVVRAAQMSATSGEETVRVDYPLPDAVRAAPRVADSSARVAGTTSSCARGDRHLQSVRGALRRRRRVREFLQASVILASARAAQLQFTAALRVAREARTWRGWWGSSEADSPEGLALVLALFELEHRIRLEQLRLDGIGEDLACALWVARAARLDEARAHLEATLAASLRFGNRTDCARRLLSGAPRDALPPDAMRRWCREALWSAMLVGDWPMAAAAAARLRALGSARGSLARALVAGELAAFHYRLGDVAGCQAALRGAEAGLRRLTTWDRARLEAVRAAVLPESAAGRRPRGRAAWPTTPAMRAETAGLRRCRSRPAGQACLAASPGAATTRGSMMDDVLELLRVCHEDEDDLQALRRACIVLRDRLHASAVGIWIDESPAPLAGVGTGRRWPSGLARRARTTGLAYGPEATEDGVEAARPIVHAGRAVGSLACRWPDRHHADEADVARLLAAAAATCAPLVRHAVDRAAAPVPADGLGLVGESTAIRDLRRGIERAARVPYHVLVEGESGSGKELVARGIHQVSPRRLKPFRAVNCAALTDDLLEAELFGHARGAFTGAVAERAGLLEDASGGTLFLDEVADLSPRGQAKVLRVLQDGEVRRLGENFSRRVDVRIVAATNKALRDEVAAGRFREDLRYRLDVLRLVLPPLRARRDDILLLSAYFWREASARVGSRASLDAGVLTALARYDWPGNVRELQNVMASLAVHAPARGRVGVEALPETVRAIVPPAAGGSLLEARRRFEMDYVRTALARAGGRRAEAARALGLTRQGLIKLITRLGLDAS